MPPDIAALVADPVSAADVLPADVPASQRASGWTGDPNVTHTSTHDRRGGTGVAEEARGDPASTRGAGRRGGEQRRALGMRRDAGPRERGALDAASRRRAQAEKPLTWSANDPHMEIVLVETPDPSGKRWAEALKYLMGVGQPDA